jgi:hypothetical protein
MVLGATADTLALVLAIVGGVGTAVTIITGLVVFVWQWRDRRAAAREAASEQARRPKPTVQTFTVSQMRDEVDGFEGFGGVHDIVGYSLEDLKRLLAGRRRRIATITPLVLLAFPILLIAGVLLFVLS